MKITLEQLTGTTNLSACLAWFLLTSIGAFTAVLIRAKLKYNYSDRTPYRWSWSLLFLDNLLNLIIGFFISLTFFRFSNLFLKTESIIWLAALFGFVSNELAILLVKFSFANRK
ncbi:hypothetical protein [Flavobacterium collinsii]|uniref:Uncharacterized protein n=1 Tax=Flavobacterium collinsii TaxID=1114861 RepID=A0A9W4TL32_9FLAO|nr:hypothetical protein [Flavobacterium collinsii]CAI2769157.1 conserved membrane protein of unknown function [Flavobacterium collinsii]